MNPNARKFVRPESPVYGARLLIIVILTTSEGFFESSCGTRYTWREGLREYIRRSFPMQCWELYVFGMIGDKKIRVDACVREDVFL